MALVFPADRGGATMTTVDVGGGYRVPMAYRDPADIKDIFDNIPNISLRPDDVMVASYPKTGTHWIYEVAMMLLLNNASPVKLNKIQTMMESRAEREMEDVPSPRVVNTHVQLRYFPKDVMEKQIKTILIVRNPKDTAVSLYNHLRGVKLYDYHGKWDDWLPLFVEGDVEYGDYADYLNEWEAVMRNGSDFPLHVVYYEDLKENGFREIIRLSKFLGVDINDEFAEEIRQACGFKKMVEEKLPPALKESLFTNGFQIFRKGEIGDWKNWFSTEQSAHFDGVWNSKMKDSIFQFRCENTRAKL